MPHDDFDLPDRLRGYAKSLLEAADEIERSRKEAPYQPLDPLPTVDYYDTVEPIGTAPPFPIPRPQWHKRGAH